MSLPRFGVQKPVPVNLLMAALIIAGIYGALTITREFFPEVAPESASVALPYPGATPEEIEESLVRKVEDALVDLDEVDELNATIAEGGGGITVKFHEGVSDVDAAVDEIENAMDALLDLPDEAERIQVSVIEPTLPVIMVSLYGEADEEVKKQAMRRIRDDLRTLPGMGEMLVYGVRDYEIRVDINADAMLAHGISLPDVSDRISNWMRDLPGGVVRTPAGNINIRTMGITERAETIRNIVIDARPDGQIIRVRDIGRVREGFVDEDIISRFSTKKLSGPSASMIVNKVGNQDAVEIAEMVRAYVRGRRYAAGDEQAVFNPGWVDRIFQVLNPPSTTDEEKSSSRGLITTQRRAYLLGLNCPDPIPPGCDIALHSDLARFIEGRLDLLTRNAFWGGMLVFGTLLIFLNWRVALWVGVGLITALCGTIIMMKISGITLNLLTMFGLIVVIGLLVDDAIVVAENIQFRHDRNETALVAAIKGTEQVFWPVVATVLTSIVAFLPLTFIQGTIGDLLGALPLVVACALSMSLLESVLILPSHMGHSLQKRDKIRPGRMGMLILGFEKKRDHVVLNIIVPAYARLLELSLRYRYVSFAVALATLIISLGMVFGGRLDFEFIPASDSETIIVELKMPVGTPIAETEAVVDRLEQAALAQDEITLVSTTIGMRTDVSDTAGLAAGAFGSHLAQLFIELHPVELRDRDSRQVIASIREQILPLDGVDRLTFREIQGGPGGAAITIQVRGEDTERMEAAVEEVKLLLAEYEGVVDIGDDNARGQREIQIHLQPGAATLGFTVANIARQVRGALYGIDAHVFSAKREDIDVRVRLDEQSRRSLHTMENLWLISPEGNRIPLGEIATLTEGVSYSTIKRVDRQRTLTVSADTVPELSPETVTAAISLAEIQNQYPDLTIRFAGRQQELRDAFSSLPLGFGAALIMVYLILAWLFSSYTQPLAIMLAIPFGFIGIIWGHLLLGYNLTFLSIIGFVALSGIVVNDALIFIEFYNSKRAEGLPIPDALIAAGRQRLRPIFLTTVTTVLGLTPLMLEQSFQAKFLIPMAVSIAFGLMSATVLILLVLPCLIVIIDDLKGAAYFLWHGGPRPTPFGAGEEGSLLDGGENALADSLPD